jgi:hypothetical protein
MVPHPSPNPCYVTTGQGSGRNPRQSAWIGAYQSHQYWMTIFQADGPGRVPPGGRDTRRRHGTNARTRREGHPHARSADRHARLAPWPT